MPKQRDSRTSGSLPTWIVVAPSVGLAIVCNHFFSDWGRVVLTAALLFGGFVGIWRRYWKHLWFWTTLVFLIGVHLVVAVRFRELLNSLDIFSLFGMLMLEVVVFALAMAIPLSLLAKDDAGKIS